jgi:hypothetical protein
VPGCSSAGKLKTLSRVAVVGRMFSSTFEEEWGGSPTQQGGNRQEGPRDRSQFPYHLHERRCR